MPAQPNRDLDLLFVIDDSPSMAPKQELLATNFPRMMDVLSQLDDGLPNLHIGVITSDMGTKGSAVDLPGPKVGTGIGECSGPGRDGVLQHAGDPALTDGYISDVAGPSGRARNYEGTLRDEFSRIARVGDAGCGFEQPLAAMRRALVNPANVGFLRAQANLAVVILSDEDDCSMLDPALMAHPSVVLGPLESFRCFEHGVVCDPDAPRTRGDKHECVPRDDSQLVEAIGPFVDALVAAKPDPRMVMVAGIVGDPSHVAVDEFPVLEPSGGPHVIKVVPTCVYYEANGLQATADPAVRIAAFLDNFPGRSRLTSICQDDLSSALEGIGESAKKLMGDPCIDTTALADTSPEPGIQPACEVSDVRDAAPGQARSLPLCGNPDSGDCYDLVADAVACPSSNDHLRVRLQRSQAATADTWTHVRCQTAAPRR